VDRRLDQARLDPELAEAQPLVGAELDRGAGQKIVAPSPRVLQQISRQLLLERALIALQLGAVLPGEVDRVLVGHVDTLDRGRLVGVHFLGQLASQFYRLHLGAEGATEDPLDETFDAGLKVA
jgi:hypothetical protein